MSLLREIHHFPFKSFGPENLSVSVWDRAVEEPGSINVGCVCVLLLPWKDMPCLCSQWYFPTKVHWQLRQSLGLSWQKTDQLNSMVYLGNHSPVMICLCPFLSYVVLEIQQDRVKDAVSISASALQFPNLAWIVLQPSWCGDIFLCTTWREREKQERRGVSSQSSFIL